MTRFIKDRFSVSLLETSSTQECRRYKVVSGNIDLGTVEFDPWGPLGFSIGEGELAVFAGLHIYLGPVDGPLKRFEFDYWIDAAYRLPGVWCLVTELSVCLFDRVNEVECSRFDHNEILLKNWWMDNRLLLRDLENKEIELSVDSETRTIKPV